MARRLSVEQLDALIVGLADDGFRVMGPVAREGVIGIGPLAGVAELPRGATDQQSAGRYRLTEGAGQALFGYNVGPFSWKRLLHPPRQHLWSADRDGDGFQVTAKASDERPLALVGVRACDLSAIGVLDRVLLEHDPAYRQRREDAVIVVVECTTEAPTCFCTSMGTGPAVGGGCDIALVEVAEPGAHWFAARGHSERGRALLEAVGAEALSPEAEAGAREQVEDVARRVGERGSRLDTRNLREDLYDKANSPHWNVVADRCINCGNCTMVCPTCFCTTVEDVTSLDGDHTERWRRWDSCFNLDFSYLHGGEIRHSAASRYRQWMTHKLGSWHDQFGESGCVGCGRCIVWCPVGIDITEEVRRLRAT